MDPNSAKIENFKNLKTYVSSYRPEAILWAISGPYIDHWDQSFFLSAKSPFNNLKSTLFQPKMKISKIRKPTFFRTPLKAYHERFQDHASITATRVFFKAQKVHFWPKMDPNSAKNENFKDPKTYVSLYTPEAILWPISGSYIDHWDPSFF